MENKTLQNMTRHELETLAYNLLCEKANLLGQVYELGEELDNLDEYVSGVVKERNELQEELSDTLDELDAWKKDAEESRERIADLEHLAEKIKQYINIIL